MKFNNKGFLLIETLIVTVFVVSTLIFLFVQFQRIEANYSRTFNYNTVDGLYRLANIRDFIEENVFFEARDQLNSSGLPYVNLSTCNLVGNLNAELAAEIEYCQLLYSVSEVKTLMLVDENTENVISELRNITFISESKKDFIKYINYEDEIGKYRLIVEYDDGTFATVIVY